MPFMVSPARDVGLPERMPGGMVVIRNRWEPTIQVLVNRFHLLEFYLHIVKKRENRRNKQIMLDFKIVDNSAAAADTLKIPTKMAGVENDRI